jgi:HK97 family phage major capsid protein
MELHAQPKATQVLLDDASIDLEAWLAEESAIAFSEAEGAAFIAVNGVKRTTGLIAYSNVEDSSWKWDSVGYVASGVAGALSDSTHNGADAILQLVGTLRGGYRQAASFLMNRLTMATIAQFKGSDGQYLLRQVYDQASPGAFPTLAGYPVHEDEHMPDIGAGTYPIAFGDFARAYLIVDRVGVSVLRDPFSSYPYVLFRTRKRVGGGIQNFEALKLLKVAAS